MRSRPAGLERCVRDILVKVAADPGLAEDPRVLALGERSIAMVEDFAYLDRMIDVPTHDEQGTRDRPYDLVGHVDPTKIAETLRGLGLKPWVVARPMLLVLVNVQRADVQFDLTADGGPGERQRQALLAAGETYGMRVAVPTVEQRAVIDTAKLDLGRLGPMNARGGLVVLIGSMIWSDPDNGWNCTWHATLDGQVRTWTIRGVSFDEGFRSGVGGAAHAAASRAK
jgi:hypothetical protein